MLVVADHLCELVKYNLVPSLRLSLIWGSSGGVTVAFDQCELFDKFLIFLINDVLVKIPDLLHLTQKYKNRLFYFDLNLTDVSQLG